MDSKCNEPACLKAGTLDKLLKHRLVEEPTGLEYCRLAKHLDEAPRSAYCGFDPTADSLHLGNLVPIVALRHLQLHGHRPIILIGGATGLIGDPSGKKDERSLNSDDTVRSWTEKLGRQIKDLLDFDAGSACGLLVNNADWITPVQLIQFLRDVGKHFRVGEMIGKAFVRDRLSGAGISFTEFTYTLLQAYDHAWLNRNYGCTIQVGGRDQWGNILHGIDYLRKVSNIESFGLTVPLLTKSDGSKFGKSEQGNIWLDASRTSPFIMHQYFLQATDADAIAWLPIFTFLSHDELLSITAEHERAPETRVAQNRLADEVVRYVHGDQAVLLSRRVGAALFGDADVAVNNDAISAMMKMNGLPCFCHHNGSVLDLLIDADLAKSKRQAREFLENGAIFWNGRELAKGNESIPPDRLLERFAILRRGKREARLIVFP